MGMRHPRFCEIVGSWKVSLVQIAVRWAHSVSSNCSGTVVQADDTLPAEHSVSDEALCEGVFGGLWSVSDEEVLWKVCGLAGRLSRLLHR